MERKTYVKTKNNDMEAYVFLATPDPGVVYTKEEVLRMLNDHGVTEGINESNVAAMVRKGVYNKEIKVAEGRPAVHGRDGYFEYYFDMDQKKKQPLIRADGTVDYTSINIIKCVMIDDVLAKYQPPMQGKPGVNVRGKVLPPRPAKELRRLSGSGIDYDETMQTYHATVDGKVELNGSRLNVVSLHEIHGDIDAVFGNIDFKGDIIIYGNVKPGIKIIATKSITVNGIVEGSDLSAGTDIIVKGGILGAERSRIEAEGDLLADFVEYATVFVKGNVRANSILNSNVTAGDQILATGKTGTILGGNIYAMSAVSCIIAGNDAFLRTVIAAGIKNQVQQDQYALSHKVENLTAAIKKIEKEVDDIERSIRLGMSDDGKVMRKQYLTREKIQKDWALKENKLLIDSMSMQMEGGKDPFIQVKGIAYAGCVIQIDEQQISIDRNRDYIEFKKDQEGNMIIKNIF